MRCGSPGVPIHPEKEPVMTKETKQALITNMRELAAMSLYVTGFVTLVLTVTCGPSLLAGDDARPVHHTTLLARR